MLSNIEANKASWDGIISEAEADKQRQIDLAAESSEEENQDPNVHQNVTIVIHEKDEISEPRLDCVISGADVSVPECQPRRHSLPQPMLPKDLTIMFPRRSSLPKVQDLKLEKRTSSVPKSLRLQLAGSSDKLSKLSSLAEAIQPNVEEEEEGEGIGLVLENRSKITSLSCDPETTRLLSALSSHNVQHHICRNVNSRASLPILHLPPMSRSSWCKDSDVELAMHSFHHRNSLQNSSLLHSANTTSRTNGNGVRQVLRPLSSNRRINSLEVTPVRGRSGSEEATVIGQRALSLHTGILYERPRSLSLDIESQPLLRAAKERKSFSGKKTKKHFHAL